VERWNIMVVYLPACIDIAIRVRHHLHK
jgi:hypothetical protein